MQLQIKKVNPNAIIPTRNNPTDSGLDLYACLDNDVVIESSLIIPTGIAIKLPESDVLNRICEGQIRPRSGLAAKHGISCHLGTIDNAYVGELKVVMYNFSNKPFVVTHGMKIAQLVLASVYIPDITLVDELGVTDRGSNGFGSSGI